MRHRDLDGLEAPGGGAPDPAPDPAGARPADAHGSTAVAWALHALEPGEEIEFLAHLDRCPVCPRVVAEVTATLEVVAGAVPDEEPPPGLRDRILDAARAEAAATPPEGLPLVPLGPSALASTRRTGAGTTGAFWGPVAPGERIADVVPLSRPRADPDRARRPGSGRGGSVGGARRPRRRALTRVGAVAASLAVVAAVGGIVAVDRALERSRAEASAAGSEAATANASAAAASAAAGRSDQVVRVLAAAGAPGARHATLATPSGDLVGLVVDTDGGPQLVTTGLAGNAADRIYVLWGLTAADAAPTGLGAFDVPGVDPSARSVPSGPDRPFAAYAVSLEPGRSVPSSPTDVVASGQVTQ